jgi:hypothetical protein
MCADNTAHTALTVETACQVHASCTLRLLQQNTCHQQGPTSPMNEQGASDMPGLGDTYVRGSTAQHAVG